MNHFVKQNLAVVAGLLFCLNANAGDIVAGKAKADQVCASCHGVDGIKTAAPEYPKLAGQHADFLKRALLDYQKGNRKNPTMMAMAGPLTRVEIDNLSAYFASLPSDLAERK
jgi:cytochrome c553